MKREANAALAQDLLVPRDEFFERIDKAKTKMRETGLDALIIYSDGYRPGHNRYFANYIPSSQWRVSIVVIPATGEPTLIIDREFLFAHAKKVSPIEDVRAITSPWHSGLKFLELVYEVIGEKKLNDTALGVVGLDIMPATFFENLKRGLPGATLTDATGISEKIRVVKSPREIDIMRQAVRIAECGLKTAIEVIKPGRTELQVAAAVRKAMLEAHEYYCLPFPYFYIQSGVESEVPQRAPFATDKEIRDGELILMDIGTCYGGYCADLARSHVPGYVSDDARALLVASAAVSDVACAAAVKGATPSKIVGAAVEELEKRGYGKENLFQAYQGHSIGIEVGESPLITGEIHTALEPGMVFCIEPGIGVKGLGGARVEEMVVVTDHKPEYLSTMERVFV